MAAGWLRADPSWVEPAIAASIIALALLDAFFLWRDPFAISHSRAKHYGTFALVAGFGLVHGLGFGTGFVAVASRGLDGAQLAGAVATFTCGVEAAQLLILAVLWVVAWVIFDLWQWRPLELRRLTLLAVAFAGGYLLWQTLTQMEL